MTEGQYISVREAAQILGVTEKQVMDLIETKKVQAYRIANQFLRLKKSEIQGLRTTGTVKAENIDFPYTPIERIRDFFYFNDFFIFAFLLILVLLYLIVFF